MQVFERVNSVTRVSRLYTTQCDWKRQLFVERHHHDQDFNENAAMC